MLQTLTLPNIIPFAPHSGSRPVMALAGLLLTTAAMHILSANTYAVPLDEQPKKKTAAEQDPRIGRKVIVTTAGAPLRTPEATVWEAYLGETFTISLTNGEWLWIGEKGGWLFEQHAVMFDDAVEQMNAKIEAEESSENYHLRGVAYLAHGKYDKSIADLTKSLGIKPDVANVHNERGKAWYLKAEYGKAIADFNTAVKVDPNHFMAFNNRGLAHLATGKLDQARKDLTSAIKHNRKFSEAYNNRGVVNANKGDFRAAVNDYDSALKIDPAYIEALGNRSFAHRQLGQFERAVADLSTAIRMKPQDYQPVNDLAWLLATVSDRATRNPAQAVKLATAACQMTGYQDWNTLDTLAAAHAAAGDFKQAQQWAQTAVQKAPAAEKAGPQAHLEMFLKKQAISM